ncbi:CatA-like O-acetyltransferase [Jeotgalibacillus soli]|uniref:Branched-chain alpha-keto acid dehydrogenase subunit E2 n=1 Tax=Jeotgalibacillus soli TaxID=889306 RepID=A0A0C2VN19_9BACL|nr:CatA-like O-acetyltransferase [Jeotgalibacillus soli]KIL45398.1 branched-chain alpha-keto acid dehydrogenase subunit E2 [Jeotgalibacillus soli]
MKLQVSRIFASPRARKMAELQNIPLDQVEGSGATGRIIEEDLRFYKQKNKSAYINSGSKTFKKMEPKIVKATPLAKQIAKVEKIHLNAIRGSGLDGKITSSDVLQLVANVSRTSFESALESEHRIPLTGMRKIIAERMLYSKQTSPHVTITVKAEVTRFDEYRKQGMKNGIKFSFTDLMIMIVAQSLQNHPKINVSLDKQEIVYYQDCNIGVAVALDDGLVVPVIHHANQKSLSVISKELKEKVNRVKQGKFLPEDLQNGRFTISNLGMYNVDAFTPIINQPESAILGIGRIIEDLLVQNGQIRIGKTMVLSLSFDHRVIDGVPAALFLNNIKDIIENLELLQIS